VVLCPPWGGVDIKRYSKEPIDQVMSPSLTRILQHAAQFSRNMLIQMPKNIILHDFFSCLLQVTGIQKAVVHLIEVNGKLSQLLICVGDLFVPRGLELEQVQRHLELDRTQAALAKEDPAQAYRWYFQLH
jgi:hypothetical protein